MSTGAPQCAERASRGLASFTLLAALPLCCAGSTRSQNSRARRCQRRGATSGSARRHHEIHLSAAAATLAFALAGASWRSTSTKATRPARQGQVRQLVRCQGAGRVRSAPWRCCTRSGSAPARRRFATSSRTTRAARIATWGIAAILMSNPLAGQGASPQARGDARRRRSSRAGASPRKTAARARLHRGRGRATTTISRASPSAPARRRARRRSKRWPRATPTTTRRRSSPRSTSPARSRRPTRPTPPT